ncbi:MAG: alpha/beta hydrolase [Pyrinomonadaceae bacterium]|nr:alpha/beta hydrolase [Pyrinomonadaceae bacterium]
MERITLHYAEAGTGDQLVVLLHGFPEFWYSWRHQLKDLAAAGYTVVAPDMRGYNLSDKPADVSAYEIEELVQDVSDLIEHLGFEKAVVIGHDWGAGVAWAFSQRKPEMLTKLASLQVPPPSIWKKNQTVSQFLASWYMFFFQLPWLPELMLTSSDFRKLAIALKTTTAEKGVFSDEDVALYKKAWSQEGAITGGLNYYRANILKRMFGKGIPPKKIDVPTLFIYGEQDHAVLPQTVANTGDIVSGEYRELRIPESGHWVQNEARETVSATLIEFLSDG